jgi:hypothetical protein
MLPRKFGGTYATHAPNTTSAFQKVANFISFPNVGNSNLLREKSSRTEQACEQWIMNKITDTERIFVIYNINLINLLAFANESLQVFDEMGKQCSGKNLWA